MIAIFTQTANNDPIAINSAQVTRAAEDPGQTPPGAFVYYVGGPTAGIKVKEDLATVVAALNA